MGDRTLVVLKSYPRGGHWYLITQTLFHLGDNVVILAAETGYDIRGRVLKFSQVMEGGVMTLVYQIQI